MILTPQKDLHILIKSTQPELLTLERFYREQCKRHNAGRWCSKLTPKDLYIFTASLFSHSIQLPKNQFGPLFFYRSKQQLDYKTFISRHISFNSYGGWAEQVPSRKNTNFSNRSNIIFVKVNLEPPTGTCSFLSKSVTWQKKSRNQSRGPDVQKEVHSTQQWKTREDKVLL